MSNWVISFYKKYLDHFIKIIVILISVIYPFILLSVEGELKSLSQYWNTSLQPLFIVANVMTAYIFLSIGKIFWAEGKEQKARKFLQRAVELNNDLADAWVYLYTFEK